MIFTLGNIITLCIVALALVLYRLADKNNRSMSNVRKYAEKCKDDIAVYVEEKSIAVKNFGINLDVEQKAAAKYLENIQKLTQEELAKKYESITRIEDHINAFESSLEELNGMTDRVQENLNLIRDESAFVENTGRRVSEAKERYEQLERAINNAARNLEETEERLERKNTESLEITANEVIKSAKSIVSDFETTAHVIERKIEEHKQAVTKSEREREAILSRDLELVKKTLKEVLENAGKRADKLEDAALVKLREQAVERVNNVKASFEEKIKAVQENLKTEQGTISEKLKEINTSQKNIQQEWTNELDKINSTIEKQMESWKLLCRDTEQNIIAENEKRLEEYNKIQTEAVRQLNSLADDSGHLEKELRQSMQDAISRVKGDFSSFEKETGASMQTAASTFNAQAETFRQELEDMDKQLDGIRQQAYDNVSEKLTAFENDFTSELGKRTSEFGRQISNWQAGLQEKIEISGERINKDLQQAEERIVIEQRKNIAVLGERLTSDLERLKQETSAFEMGIREEMDNVDETRLSFAEQIKQNLSEMRIKAETEVKTQIGQHQLSMQETLRQKQRELEKEIEAISGHSKDAYASLENTAVKTRQTFDEWQGSYNTRMREMDNSLEELRRHCRETAAENDERVLMFRQSLDSIRKELDIQKKIYDQTGELKQDLEHRIEELNADLDRLNHRKTEVTELENQFTHIKRLVEDMNRKMTSFLSEKHRIEVMQKDFERFIKTSQSVEEKLAQVSSSDDILQSVQVQIRKLEDSIRETEDKYNRIERKNEVLEETNEGIDRNFKALQKTESAIKNADKIINELSDQFDSLRSSIEALAAENAKATEAAEKITILDESLAKIENRITEMNVAREWLARTETELKALNKDAKTHVNLAKGLISRESGKAAALTSKGAPAPQDRDNVIRLKEQGWTVEEIANAMNMGRGEVELILEIGSRG